MPDAIAFSRLRPCSALNRSRSSSIAGYIPSAALTRNVRPPTRPTWTGAGAARSSARVASARSGGTPCVRANRLKVPRGSTPNTSPRDTACAATELSVPSPPAATSAPPCRCAASTASATTVACRSGASIRWIVCFWPAASTAAAMREHAASASSRPDPAFRTIDSGAAGSYRGGVAEAAAGGGVTVIQPTVAAGPCRADQAGKTKPRRSGASNLVPEIGPTGHLSAAAGLCRMGRKRPDFRAAARPSIRRMVPGLAGL